jgi:myo-inositol catabolism protein IolC
MSEGPGELYSLAFDHRGVFRRELFGIDGEPDAAQEAAIADAKSVIFDGVEAALASGEVAAEAVGILVDERHGAEIARRARERGISLAMPVERSDRDLFEFEYGDEFAEHIERFDPDFAKVLVRLNPDGDAAGNELQLERLRELSEYLRRSGRGLMFELIVTPTAPQLAAVAGDRDRFTSELRPELIVRAIAAAQEAGVEADVWKLEGVDAAADAEAIVSQARSGPAREGVGCIVLGAGASRKRVEHWLGVAAAVEGFNGFAIGRSIWAEPLRAQLAGEIDREQAAARIAARYLDFIGTYRAVAAPGSAR